MDTAGLHATTDPVETLGVERTQAAIADAAAVVAVFDRAVPLTEEDRVIGEIVGRRPGIAVLNKADLAASVARAEIAALVGGVAIVEVSAVTGLGLRTVTEALAHVLFGAATSDEDEVAIFRVRHRDAARRAVEDLDRAASALCAEAPLDLVAQDLAAAATELAGITGEVTSEDVLDRIFADFCIGK
jgi:tRNA modification GTPase